MANSYEAATLFMLYSKGYEDGAKQVVNANDRISGSLKKVSNEATKAVDHVERLQKMQREEMRLGNQPGFKGSGRASQFVSQLGYGLEDFSVGYQLGGAQMAMRGVTNNLTMMAMSIGGLYGALAALGTVLAVSVLPGLSKLAQYTTVFQGLEKTVKDFHDAIEARKSKIKNQRKIEDDLRSFESLSSPDQIVSRIEEQQREVDRLKQDAADAEKDVWAAMNLKEKLVDGDLAELDRTNIVRRSLADFSPVASNIFGTLIGAESYALRGNTEAILKEMNTRINQLNSEHTKLADAAKTEQEILDSMKEKAPGMVSKLTHTSMEESKAAFNERMNQGNKLVAQYEKEKKAILEQAEAMRQHARTLVDEYGDDKGLSRQADDWEQQHLSQLDAEHSRRVADANTDLDKQISQLEDGLLSPVERVIKEITQQAQELRESVHRSTLLADQQAAAIDRVDAWEESAKKKEMMPQDRIQGTPLQTIMAGSDQIFSNLQRQELDELRKIAKNTAEKGTKFHLVGKQ